MLRICFIYSCCFFFIQILITDIKHDMPNIELPAIALLALADGVKLGMLPASHKIVAKDSVNGLCQPIEFQFKVGEILIFHPLFVHYGCSYSVDERNLRVHFYFDNDELVRETGDGHLRTFFLDLSVQEICCPSDIERWPAKKKTSGRGAHLRKTSKD